MNPDKSIIRVFFVLNWNQSIDFKHRRYRLIFYNEVNPFNCSVPFFNVTREIFIHYPAYVLVIPLSYLCLISVLLNSKINQIYLEYKSNIIRIYTVYIRYIYGIKLNLIKQR